MNWQSGFRFMTLIAMCCSLVAGCTTPQQGGATSSRIAATPEKNDEVRKVAEEWFDVVGRGDFDSARRLATDDWLRSVNFDRGWIPMEKRFQKESGRELSRSYISATWYKDPPSAPFRGVFVGVDFERAFEKVTTRESVILYQLAPGQFRTQAVMRTVLKGTITPPPSRNLWKAEVGTKRLADGSFIAIVRGNGIAALEQAMERAGDALAAACQGTKPEVSGSSSEEIQSSPGQVDTRIVTFEIRFRCTETTI